MMLVAYTSGAVVCELTRVQLTYLRMPRSTFFQHIYKSGIIQECAQELRTSKALQHRLCPRLGQPALKHTDT